MNMEIKDALTIASLGIAFITVAYTIYNSRKTTYINAVTTARIKYMEALRGYIAEFCGLTLHYSLTPLSPAEEQQIIKQIDKLRFTIKLHLNPKRQIDLSVIQKINNIPNLTDPKKIKMLEDELNELTRLTQSVLALEWAGIKKEASNGRLYGWEKKKLLKENI